MVIWNLFTYKTAAQTQRSSLKFFASFITLLDPSGAKVIKISQFWYLQNDSRFILYWLGSYRNPISQNYMIIKLPQPLIALIWNDLEGKYSCVYQLKKGIQTP